MSPKYIFAANGESFFNFLRYLSPGLIKFSFLKTILLLFSLGLFKKDKSISSVFSGGSKLKFDSGFSKSEVEPVLPS